MSNKAETARVVGADRTREGLLRFRLGFAMIAGGIVVDSIAVPLLEVVKKVNWKRDVVGRFVWESSEPESAACRWRGKKRTPELARLEITVESPLAKYWSLKSHLLGLKGDDRDRMRMRLRVEGGVKC